MQAEELKKQIKGLSIEDQLKKLVTRFPGKMIFTTSLGIEEKWLS
jgi:hypothetical protein